ncbi:MAG: hypothetical protein ABI718_10810 [Acidobacteriota bacterium]
MNLPDRLRSSWGSLLVVAATIAALLFAIPLLRGYFDKLSGLHSKGLVAALVGTGLLAFAAGVAVLWRFRFASLIALAAVLALLVVSSGNAIAFVGAGVVAVLTLITGDLVASVIASRERIAEDLPASFVTGTISLALIVLLLGELRLLNVWTFLLVTAGIVAMARNRLPLLAEQVREVASKTGGPERFVESLFAGFTICALAATFVIALAPDTSYDGLAYHLPEVRDTAMNLRVEPIADLYPQTLFWRSHETWLAIGYRLAGERAVRVLQFLFGLVGLAAAVVLARRLDRQVSGSLVAFSIAAYPFACYQFRGALVDWPAGVMIAAAACEIAAVPFQRGRSWLAAFLAGGAIATKIFAALALPALLIFCWFRTPRERRVKQFAIVVIFGLIPLLPWFAWTETRAGFFLAPYAESARTLAERFGHGYFFAANVKRHDADGLALAAGRQSTISPVDFLKLPLTLTYKSSRYEGFRDGYGGLVAMLLCIGILGWRWQRVLMFLAAALMALVPWYLIYQPSSRYLLPVYPLFAVFTCVGLSRLTRRFHGWEGRLAACALTIAALALPVQVGSSGREWKYTTGLIDEKQFLDESLISHRFWSSVPAGENAILIGEEDRYHAPFASAFRAEWPPVSRWGDSASWSRGIDMLHISYVVDRGRWPKATPILEGLGSRLTPVQRNGEAVLYRVR